MAMCPLTNMSCEDHFNMIRGHAKSTNWCTDNAIKQPNRRIILFMVIIFAVKIDVCFLSLQDIVMQRLDEKHKQECNLLVHFLSKSPSKDNRKRLEVSTDYERQEMRNDLHNTWKNTQSGT